MRENRIDWTRFFKPVCLLCMVCGGLWLWWQMSLTENLLGRITAIAGGVLFLLGGLFGLLGKPRALVPLLDFLALAASLIALWKIGLCWQAIAGVVLSALSWYAPLAEFAGAGATVPLLGFGHLLAKGVKTAIEEEGAIGILTGGLTAAAAGITTSLVCGVVCSWVGKSHDQN